jgi:TfoX/Sxy family transcriptional regulator of competence genes
MAYDVELADRIRDIVEGLPGLSEKKMFGGLAFLVNGNMAVAASGQGGLLLRVDPADSAELIEIAGVERMVMRGREMDGWLRIDETVIGSDEELHRWADIGVDYAQSLPAK